LAKLLKNEGFIIQYTSILPKMKLMHVG